MEVFLFLSNIQRVLLPLECSNYSSFNSKITNFHWQHMVKEITHMTTGKQKWALELDNQADPIFDHIEMKSQSKRKYAKN